MIPILAPLPRRWWAVVLALGVSAWLLLLPTSPGTFPGDEREAPVALNLHWQVHERGLAGTIADDLHGYPFRSDRTVIDGVPLAAITSAPLCAAFGFAGGMWAWILGVLWIAGAGAAWLAMRWWGTAGAGLIAGFGFQTSEALVGSVADGRSGMAFAACFLAPALLWGVRGNVVVAGVIAGFGSLAYAPWALPLLAFALGPSLLARRAPLAGLAAWAVVVGIPLAWVLSGRNELPALDPWAPALFNFQQVRPVDLALGRIQAEMLGVLARPVLLGLAAWTVWRARLRHVWIPALATLVFVILGLGAWLPGPVVLPGGWIAGVLWWPDRWWLVVALGIALLAGGAAPAGRAGRAGRAGPAAVVLAEVLLSPSLPMGVIELKPAASAVVLARAPDVPLVLLPLGGGRLRPDRLDLIDQIGHGRPMASGTRSPLDRAAPDALLRSWNSNRGLRALAGCERGDGPPAAGAAPEGGETLDLVHAGLREVYLDPRYVGGDADYVACVERVLTGWERLEEAPLVRYRAPG